MVRVHSGLPYLFSLVSLSVHAFLHSSAPFRAPIHNSKTFASAWPRCRRYRPANQLRQPVPVLRPGWDYGPCMQVTILSMPHTQNTLETLRRVPIFNGLTETELQFLAERAVPRQYRKGELLFTEGDLCTGLFVIESGHVRIFKSSPNGREQILTIEGPGSSVAELPLFDGGTYPASTAATDNARIYFISKQDFHSLCLVHPQVPLKVLKVVGGRLRKLVGIIEELSFTTVRSRLISVLVRLAKAGKKTPAGIEIQLPPSNQELASAIGTVRELVSRNLSRLQAEDLIFMDAKTVIIPDLGRLQAELEASE
jgi:CRP/FNR family cyclic AMP-dependent transcriptional regulator